MPESENLPGYDAQNTSPALRGCMNAVQCEAAVAAPECGMQLFLCPLPAGTLFTSHDRQTLQEAVSEVGVRFGYRL